jgi:hypothetical protein
MANESTAAPFDAAAYAQLLASALDLIDAELDRAPGDAETEALSGALAGPVAAFDALAREALG